MNQKISTKEKAALHTELRGNTPRERLLHRLHCVALVLNGFSAVKVSQMYGDSARSISYWVKRFEEKGVDGLQEEAGRGRPSKLTAMQFKETQAFVRKTHSAIKPVTSPMLAKYIKDRFGVSFTTLQCWRLLKQMKP